MFFLFIPFVFSWQHKVLLSVVYTVARELALVKPYKQLTMPQGQEKTNGVFYVFVQALQHSVEDVYKW